MRLGAIAVNTFKESSRNHVTVNILLFALGLMLLAVVVGDWSLGNQDKLILDFGLSAMSIFGLLSAVFIGIRLVAQEIESRTVEIIASKPVPRREILIGKFLGFGMTLGLMVLVMSAALFMVYAAMMHRLPWELVPALVLIFIEMLLIVSFAILFSCIASASLAALFTCVVFATGHLSGFLRDFIQLYPNRGFHGLFRLLYAVLPNLEKLNLKMAVVERLPATHQFEWGLIYGSAYTAIVLTLAVILFERKDFK
jgi:Cu-processing system permease protein